MQHCEQGKLYVVFVMSTKPLYELKRQDKTPQPCLHLREHLHSLALRQEIVIEIIICLSHISHLNTLILEDLFLSVFHFDTMSEYVNCQSLPFANPIATINMLETYSILK